MKKFFAFLVAVFCVCSCLLSCSEAEVYGGDIVGEWTTTLEQEGLMLVTVFSFGADGKGRVEVEEMHLSDENNGLGEAIDTEGYKEEMSYDFEYSVKGNKLTMVHPDEGEGTTEYKVDGDKLVLIAEDYTMEFVRKSK